MIGLGLWISRMVPALGNPIVVGPDVAFVVDSRFGDDAGDGRTVPLKTIAELKRRMLPGDVIALARGSHWREQLDLPDGARVIVVGTGEPPIIDGARQITGGWTRHSAHPDVWSVPWSRESTDPSPLEKLGVWIDGAMPREAESLAALSANGGVHVSDWYRHDATISVRSAVDPAASGATYEASAFDNAVRWADGTNAATLTGPVELVRGVGEGGVLASRGGSVERVLVRFGGRRHAVVDCDAADIICADDFIDYRSADRGTLTHVPFKFETPSPSGRTRSARRVFVVSDATPATVSRNNGFHASGTNETQTFGRIDYVQSAAVGTQRGFDARTDELRLEGCYAEGIVTAAPIDRPTTRIRHLMVNRPRSDPSTYVLSGHGVTDTTDKDTIVEHSCIFINAENFASMVLRWGRHGTLILRNNVIVFSGSSGLQPCVHVGSAGDASRLSAVLEHNVFVTPTTDDSTTNYILRKGRGDILSSDRNIFFASANRNFRNDRTNLQSFAQWQALGLDANSVFVDTTNYIDIVTRYFAGSPSSGDFRLADLAFLGTFGDGTPLNAAGPQEHFDWNAREVVSGAPQRWPDVPRSLAEQRAYIDAPETWDFYPFTAIPVVENGYWVDENSWSDAGYWKDGA